MQALGFDAAKFFSEIGARAGAIEPGVSLLESLWFRPTIELNGIAGGYDGPGGKTVIPCEAHAKITCRLGPGQVPEHAGAAVEAHLRAHCPPWADIEVRRERKGTAAYAVPEDDPFLAAIERVIEQVSGRKTAARRRRRHAADIRDGEGAARVGDGDAVLRRRRRAHPRAERIFSTFVVR